MNVDSIEHLHDEARSFMEKNDIFYDGDFPETSGDKVIKFSGESNRNDKRCWLKCSYFESEKGVPGLCITFGCHNGIEDYKKITNKFWVNDESWAKVSQEEKERIIERRNEQARIAKEKAAQDQEKADELANQAHDRFFKAIISPPRDAKTYFSKKGLANPCDTHNLRWECELDHSKGKPEEIWVAIVALKNIKSEIRGIQELWPEKRDFGDKKPRNKNYTGKTSGNFFCYGNLENGNPICVSEGVANAITVFLATSQTSIAAMDCGNLEKVAKNLHTRFPDSQITICADNDHHQLTNPKVQGNPGLETATKVCQKYQFKLAVPQFSESERFDSEGNPMTDFDDLRRISGLDNVKTAIETAKIIPFAQEALFTSSVKESPDESSASSQDNGLRSEQSLIEDVSEEVNTAAQDNRSFKKYSLLDLMEMPEKEWLVDNVIGKKDIGMVFGPPEAGKTFAVIDMAICCNLGINCADRFQVEKPLTVAYCAGEGVSGLKSRFESALKKHKTCADSLKNFIFFSTMPQLYSGTKNNTADSIETFIREYELDLSIGKAAPLDILFIDTLHTATVGADENSSKDMGTVLHSCRLASNKLRCAVILVHHTDKPGNAERGSSALRGAMDVMIKIKKTSGNSKISIMECSKLKDGEQWNKQNFELTPVDGTKSVCVEWKKTSDSPEEKGKENFYAETILREFQSNPGNQFTAAQVKEITGIGESHIRNLLKKMAEDGLCKRALKNPHLKGSKTNPYVN